MATRPSKSESGKPISPLMVRLDEESKQCLFAAAELRQISVSDYVRTVTVAQAQREVRAARENILTLTPDEQLSFWTALNESTKFTPAQRKLGKVMRGEK